MPTTINGTTGINLIQDGTIVAADFASSTGSGATVLATSPTITTPTIATPTITNATITVASTAAPTFRASKNSTQSITSSTWTKVQYNVENWDTNNNYDNATNYRFTPTVAGYYQVDMSVEFNNVAGSYVAAIYKNGVSYVVSAFYAGASGGSTPSVHALIYMNGSTDYLEGYGYTGVATQLFYNGDATYFNASLARSA